MFSGFLTILERMASSSLNITASIFLRMMISVLSLILLTGLILPHLECTIQYTWRWQLPVSRDFVRRMRLASTNLVLWTVLYKYYYYTFNRLFLNILNCINKIINHYTMMHRLCTYSNPRPLSQCTSFATFIREKSMLEYSLD